MNIEEQCLDLCNIKTKSNDDGDQNTTNSTEGLTPRISELMAEGDGKIQNIVSTEASEMYLMPQLTDNLPSMEETNHHQAQQAPLEIDEVNGNKTNTFTPDTPAIVNPSDSIFSMDEQHKVDIVKEEMKDSSADLVVEDGDDVGDMDIGVDLSLDESGVLEGKTENISPLSDSASNAEFHPLSDTNQPSSTDASGQAGLYPSVLEEDDKHKANGKRVTFPSDDDIVSGAVEPKDPWRHAQNVTVEEILTYYKQACQKLNCKPITKVLKQIQELKDLTQRNECLDLKGEKLDHKACESLEEILKRIQFKVIDLEQTNLDEDGASALFDMIEYYESATHLNISFNKHIGTRGWQAAAHMMRKTSSLQYLDARNTPLLDHSAPFVARALRISGSLAVLHLENAGLSGRPLMLLATALKMNMNLRELYLADNKLNGLQDSAQLGNLLKFNYNIQILDLRNNHILDSGLAYVCEGLKEQRKGLVTLVLWNNQLTHNGMGYLAAALPCTQSLETLNLGHNSVGNEGVHKLKDGLITNRSVLRLGLASTKLSCEGAVAVAEFIAESPRLLRLDLRENEIKTGGLMALSLALKVNTSLLRLDLDREPKKETVKSFIETQRALLAEIQNGCKRNFILAKEKEETDQKMRQSASMAEIATEDGTREEVVEEENTAEKTQDGQKKEEDGQTTEKEEQTNSQSETNVPQTVLESDSDTEDEEETELGTSSASTEQIPPPHPPSNAGLPQTSSPPPTSAPSVISGITVTESSPPPGAPLSPGRCISVSSPGRGHKIFMVTRVESPPEPLMNSSAAFSKTKDASEKSTDTNPQPSLQNLPQPSTQTDDRPTHPTLEDGKQGTPVSSTHCQRNHLQSTQSHPLETEPTEDVTAPNPQGEPVQSEQNESSQLDHEEPETPKSPKGGEQEEEEEEEEAEGPKMLINDLRQPQNSLLTQQQLLISALEPVLRDQTPAPQEVQSSNQKQEQSTPVTSPEPENISLIKKEEPSPEDASPRPHSEADEPKAELVSESEPSDTENTNLESSPSPEEASETPRPSTTTPPCVTELNPDSPAEEDESAEESSADEGECFADALDDEQEVSSALPNGLKSQFTRHLLSTESPKPGSCVMEHVSVSCGQELEEMLLEASLETGRDAP
ncbi:protein phosphatase 1 regulatory subunit 37 isoform X2 [Gouania willdenowi]|uniref:Protein phosphatase 1 regulatory subunit 37 n=1 Tax=Gouania willdenowi TaxID=441366 RepID=A0A8C5GAH2_GOUWI|nr:protein phosphatase 1 regulatory subunit 37 isoform X2 [Gouania willdenowi]